MLIVDEGQRILKVLKERSLDVDALCAPVRGCTPSEFASAPLEGRGEPLLADAVALSRLPFDEVLARFNTHTAVLLFADGGVDQEWMRRVLALSERVIGVYQLPLGEQAAAVLNNQLLSFLRQKEERARLGEQMARFSREMDELIRATHLDMHRAKKIHEDVVPKRMEDLKGVSLYSKYAVGEGSGSEYFDLVKGPAHTHLVFLHTDSYLVSSCLMGILNKHKAYPAGLDPESFLHEAAMEVRSVNAHKKKPVKAHVLLLRLEQGSLQCSGHCYGGFELHGQDKGRVVLPSGLELGAPTDKARFSLSLARGEKLVVFSPGFISNWDEAGGSTSREAFMAAHAGLSSQELLMELFFQIKKHSSGDFLAKDATAVMMEVNRHAIQQV